MRRFTAPRPKTAGWMMLCAWHQQNSRAALISMKLTVVLRRYYYSLFL
jgi:hypothetical protein